MELVKIPAHVGIIMDGKGRWAKARGKKRSFGHREGSKMVDKIFTHAFKRGVRALTLYAFSSENWARPQEEVDALMDLLATYFKKFIKKVEKNNVKLVVVGGRDRLSDSLKRIIEDGENATKDNTEHVLNIALNYGGRQEIVHAVNSLIKDGE